MEGQNTTKNKQLATQLTFGDGQKCGADAKRNGQLHWHITQAHAWATTQIARGLLCTPTEIVDMPKCEQKGAQARMVDAQHQHLRMPKRKTTSWRASQHTQHLAHLQKRDQNMCHTPLCSCVAAKRGTQARQHGTYTDPRTSTHSCISTQTQLRNTYDMSFASKKESSQSSHGSVRLHGFIFLH